MGVLAVELEEQLEDGVDVAHHFLAVVQVQVLLVPKDVRDVLQVDAVEAPLPQAVLQVFQVLTLQLQMLKNYLPRLLLFLGRWLKLEAVEVGLHLFIH